ncbi:MAG: M20/M25/M40 family metallo-hydrolase [Chloroflexi bacterium]|nr:M20/M25/M40 family metallo-hydrolase [Chloroflexota bacterium]
MPTIDELLASVDAARDEIVRLHQDLVRIPSVNTGPRPDTGNETPCCELLRERLADVGIASDIYESAPNRGNLIARLKGPEGGKRLLLMSHSDVVPVEDESLWEHPPFSGTIDRGRVYGRGADDDKGDVTAHGMAMILLARAGVRLGGELIYMVNADEESGGRWGAGWVAEHHAEKVAADVAINEGSGAPIHTPQGLIYPICTGEKGRLEARITKMGRSGHASRPWATPNPVPVLAQVIDKIAAYEPEIDVSHPYFREVLEALGIEHTPNAENIDRIADELAARGQGALAVTLKAASRMTITPTMLDAGVKSNSIPDRAHVVCDVRALPGQDDRYLRQELEHICEGHGVEIDIDYTAVSNASPADSPFVELCRLSLAKAIGNEDFRFAPAVTVGFTDSRFFRPHGTQVYGFNPHHPNADPNRSGVHGNNEFLEIDSLMLRTRNAVALACLTLGIQ